MTADRAELILERLSELADAHHLDRLHAFEAGWIPPALRPIYHAGRAYGLALAAEAALAVEAPELTSPPCYLCGGSQRLDDMPCPRCGGCGVEAPGPSL